MPKLKTHSGAKKRFKKLPSGKVKRGQRNRRHLLENKSSKRKRLLARPAYVHSANMDDMKRLLNF